MDGDGTGASHLFDPAHNAIATQGQAQPSITSCCYCSCQPSKTSSFVTHLSALLIPLATRFAASPHDYTPLATIPACARHRPCQRSSRRHHCQRTCQPPTHTTTPTRIPSHSRLPCLPHPINQMSRRLSSNHRPRPQSHAALPTRPVAPPLSTPATSQSHRRTSSLSI